MSGFCQHCRGRPSKQLRDGLWRPLPGEPVDASPVIAELVRDANQGLLGSAGGRFFGWVIGGSVPAGLAADWLTSAWDQNAALYACAPAEAVVEEICGAWLKDLLGPPADASFALVTGSDRAARLLGVGTDAITAAGADPLGRLDLDGLGRELEAGTGPAIVCLQAGEINTGAFGLWAAVSPRHRHLLAGADAADSWTTDAHKWLNVPFDCGLVFTAHPAHHRAAMSITASYLVHATSADAAAPRDQIGYNPEWSRRGRGFSVYAAIRSLGRTGIAQIIDDCCDHARRLIASIGALPGAEIVCEPELNQGLVRFTDPGGDHDSRTDRVIAAIQRDGHAWFGGTTFNGMRAMRVSVVNHSTTAHDVERAVTAVRDALTRT